MDNLYDIYYDPVIGFKILGLEQDFNHKVNQNLHAQVKQHYKQSEFDYSDIETFSIVGIISIPTDTTRKPAIKLENI